MPKRKNDGAGGSGAKTPGNVDPIPIAPASVMFKSELNISGKPPITQNCVIASEYILVSGFFGV